MFKKYLLLCALSQVAAKEEKEAQLHKQLHESVQGLMKLDKKTDSQRPPAGQVLAATTSGAKQQDIDKRSQLVKVPIDEVEAIGVKASPTYELDDIQSVTLKAFRKVIGYDTFNSILKKDRAETKDPADYYNVTVSMMIKRNPKTIATFETAKVDGKDLSKAIDKGFPYDEENVQVHNKLTVKEVLNQGKVTKKSLKTALAQKSDADGLFKLMDANVTRGALKNLVVDKPAPITVALAQKSDADGLFKLMDANVTRGALKNLVVDKPAPITVALAQKSDADGLFKLMDANVTRGALKNLVVDKPAPITVALAQKSDADGLFKLMDANVTRGALKNLVVDKPAPITVALAQKSDADGLFKLMDANVTRGALKNLVVDKPAPITVALAQKSDADGLFKLMDANVTRGALKNLVVDKPAPITVALAQKSDADGLFKLMDANVTRGALKNLVVDKPAPITVALAQTENPVENPPFNNWSVNQPSPPHQHGMKGNEDLEQRDIIIDGVNGFDYLQTHAQNPVENPPFNNWSVNQPSPPHIHGLDGKADLGQNIIVDGHHVHYLQTHDDTKLVQLMPMNRRENEPGNFLIKERDANHSPLDLAQLKQMSADGLNM